MIYDQECKSEEKKSAFNFFLRIEGVPGNDRIINLNPKIYLDTL